jgi:hypothetical protein
MITVGSKNDELRIITFYNLNSVSAQNIHYNTFFRHQAMKEITYKFRTVSIVLLFSIRRMLSHKICRFIYYILILNLTILAAIHQY